MTMLRNTLRVSMLCACALLCGAPPATALTTSAPTRIANADALRLLKTAYGEAVKFKGEWPASAAYVKQHVLPAHRKICLDSGAGRPGPRYIAVCTSFDQAGHADGGMVDLWLLLDARAPGGKPKVGARIRDIQTGGWGSPGAVRFIEIGSGRTAFALESGYTQMGWSTSNVTIYHAEIERFVEMLTVSTQLDNSGVCDPSEDRECRNKSIDLDCVLRADTTRETNGFYHLAVDVGGERGGRKVKRTISIPYQNGAYQVPTTALQRDGCDEGF